MKVQVEIITIIKEKKAMNLNSNIINKSKVE